jgi:hypothetical protein
MGYTFRPEGGGEVMPWKERSVMDEPILPLRTRHRPSTSMSLEAANIVK